MEVFIHKVPTFSFLAWIKDSFQYAWTNKAKTATLYGFSFFTCLFGIIFGVSLEYLYLKDSGLSDLNQDIILYLIISCYFTLLFPTVSNISIRLFTNEKITLDKLLIAFKPSFQLSYLILMWIGTVISLSTSALLRTFLDTGHFERTLSIVIFLSLFGYIQFFTLIMYLKKQIPFWQAFKNAAKGMKTNWRSVTCFIIVLTGFIQTSVWLTIEATELLNPFASLLERLNELNESLVGGLKGSPQEMKDLMSNFYLEFLFILLTSTSFLFFFFITQLWVLTIIAFSFHFAPYNAYLAIFSEKIFDDLGAERTLISIKNIVLRPYRLWRLKKADSDTKLQIIHSLEKDFSADTVGILVEIYENIESKEIRNACLNTLISMGHPSSEDFFFSLLKNESAHIRANAIDGLSQVKGGSKYHMQLLKLSIKEEDPTVKAAYDFLFNEDK